MRRNPGHRLACRTCDALDVDDASIQFTVHGAGDLESEGGFVFHQARTAHGHTYLVRAHWHIDDAHMDLAPLCATGDVLLAGSEGSDQNLELHACIDGPACTTHVILSRRIGDRPTCRASVAAATLEAAEDAMAALRALIPKADRHRAGALPVTFWNLGQFGSDHRERTLDPLPWDDIQDNYPGSLGAQIAALADSTEVPARLHLWHGPPGTGKTHAVRMLATAWQGWCDLHYITDPEQFFASSEYMMDVVLDVGPRWRLVVLEDAGEFLGSDAQAVAGQGFSRLLNLTDGILGYGARTMLLLTTNADLRALHPATRRAGRAASHLTFGAFGPTDARAWLDRHGSDVPVDGPRTLAELYALRDGTRPIRGGDVTRLGFA